MLLGFGGQLRPSAAWRGGRGGALPRCSRSPLPGGVPGGLGPGRRLRSSPPRCAVPRHVRGREERHVPAPPHRLPPACQPAPAEGSGAGRGAPQPHYARGRAPAPAGPRGAARSPALRLRPHLRAASPWGARSLRRAPSAARSLGRPQRRLSRLSARPVAKREPPAVRAEPEPGEPPPPALPPVSPPCPPFPTSVPPKP